MNKILWALITCISLSACVQTKTVNNDIDNVKTDKHINIPGTRLYIIPPKGFTIATSFPGIQKGNNSGIIIYDNVEGDYYTNAATFSEGAFKKQGITVYDFKELKVNGLPAKYILLQGKQNTMVIDLVFGDTTFSSMIMATYPSTDLKTGEQINEAIKSIYYDKNLKIDPFADISFTLDETKSIFKFSESALGMLLYSVGGTIKQPNDYEPIITVTTIPKDPSINAKRISETLVADLEKNGLIDTQLKNISTADVNGQLAYEVEVYGRMKGKSKLIYLLIVTGNEKAIAIQGIVSSDFEHNLKEIKNLARTIKLK